MSGTVKELPLDDNHYTMSSDKDCRDGKKSFVERLKDCIGSDGSGTGRVDE